MYWMNLVPVGICIVSLHHRTGISIKQELLPARLMNPPSGWTLKTYLRIWGTRLQYWSKVFVNASCLLRLSFNAALLWENTALILQSSLLQHRLLKLFWLSRYLTWRDWIISSNSELLSLELLVSFDLMVSFGFMVSFSFMVSFGFMVSIGLMVSLFLLLSLFDDFSVVLSKTSYMKNNKDK